jgi:mannose-6-phosphate isomerase-like protein (cupin superfamily)
MSFDPSGYLLGPDDGPHLWFLDTRMSVKAGADQTGGAFTLIEWSAPAGFGPPLHIHDREDEAFYILDGEITIDCGDHHWTAGPGDFAFLPRSIPHAFVVTGGPVRGLQLTTPSGFEQFIAEIGRPAEQPGLPAPSPPDIPRLIEAGSRYGHQILGPPPAVAPAHD